MHLQLVKHFLLQTISVWELWLRDHQIRNQRENYAWSWYQSYKVMDVDCFENLDPSLLGLLFIIPDLIQVTFEGIVAPYKRIQHVNRLASDPRCEENIQNYDRFQGYS